MDRKGGVRLVPVEHILETARFSMNVTFQDVVPNLLDVVLNNERCNYNNLNDIPWHCNVVLML